MFLYGVDEGAIILDKSEIDLFLDTNVQNKSCTNF